RMAKANQDELLACGCAPPDHEPRVSETIPEIVEVIEELVAKGAAYPAKTDTGTDVYFAVREFPGYGKLSHRNVDDLLSGARVEVGEVKKDPLDFALWKASDAETWGWESPWGKGRPGWHIECSAMSRKLLGPHFDLHGGGMDLVFPHHENEIAQSEAAWGEPFARVWLHAGFLNVDAEKMSKSLGNFVTIAQVLERNDGDALRYFLCGAHYRSQVSFDLEKLPDGRVVFPGIDEAERRVEYLHVTREALVAAADGAKANAEGPAANAKTIRDAPHRALSALDNDLNTSVALSVIAELAKVGNELVMQIQKQKKDPAAQAVSKGLAAAVVEALDTSCKPLGILQTTAADFFERARARRIRLRGLDAKAIEAKVRARTDARAAKDFAKADALRKELAELGVELQDVAATGATTWRVTI
ncbi:MAG TPA: cysteine--tRNA ligase, partial [Polyangiaceae bacterium]